MIKKSFFIRIMGIIVCGAYPFSGYGWSVFLFNTTKKSCQVTVNMLWCQDKAQKVSPGSRVRLDRGVCALTSIDARTDSQPPASFKIPFSPLDDTYYLLAEEDSLLVIRHIDKQDFTASVQQYQFFNQFYKEVSQAALKEMAQLLLQAALVEQKKKRAKEVAEEAVAEKKAREKRKQETELKALLEKATTLRQAAGERLLAALPPDEKLAYTATLLAAIVAEDAAREDLVKGLTKEPLSGTVDE